MKYVLGPDFHPLCALILLSVGVNLEAANGLDTWTGASGDNNWSTAGNWAGVNAPPIASDTPVFGTQGAGSLTLNNNLAAATTFAGLTFNATAPAFILNGNSITTTAAIADNSLNLETINLPVIMSGTHSLSAIAGGSMMFKGVISQSGTSGVTKTGGGTVSLSGSSPNTYAGPTAVNAGTLTLDFVTGAPGNNLINSASALSLGGGTLNLLGTGSSASSSQTFASTTIASGASTISVNNSAALALGAITYTAGSAAQFVGPATINGAGNVAAAGSITTISAGATGTGQLGVIGNDNAANSTGHYATVGLYDWASTDTAGGANGTSPYTIIGGSQVTGFYTATAPASTGNGGNFDMQANANLTAAAAQRACATIRFNTPAATTFNISNNLWTCGGILVTPNMAANNSVITNTSGGVWQVVRTTSNGSQQGVIWQNNVSGYLNFVAPIIDGRQTTSTATSIVQAGPGTVVYGAVNMYSSQTYLDGGISEITADSGFGLVGSGTQVNLNGGTILGNATFALDNAGANKRNVVLGNNGGGLAAVNGYTLTVDGVVSGAGQLVIGIPASSANGNNVSQVPGTGTGTANTTPVYATGTVSLSGADTYTGNTIVNSGTLALAATGTINSTPQIFTASNAIFDVSAVAGFTLGGSQSLAGYGTNNGSVSTASGSSIYAGTDGGYGTNTFNNNLTLVSGALCNLDVGSVHNGANDFISVGGTAAFTGTVFHLKAPSTTATLDTAADYVLLTAAGISGSPASTPVWDVAPANAANFIVKQSGNSIVLHYSSAAPPTGSGIATPASVNRSQSAFIAVTVTPGSSAIASVVLDATAVGGSSSVPLVQSNSTSIYTNTITVSAATAPGGKSFTATITDTTSPTPLTGQASVLLTVLNTQTWNGGGANDNWSSAANWVSGVAPVTGDFLTFAGVARPTPSMDTSYNLTGVAFDTTATSFTLGTPGGTLTLTGNGITNNSANAQTLNLPVSLSTAQTFNAAAGNLALTQPVNNGGNLVTFDGTHTNNVSGVISGNGGLAKNGTGILNLAGNNSYISGTTINAGTMVLSNSFALGTGTLTRIGGVVQLADGLSVTNSWQQGSSDTTDSQLDVPAAGAFASWMGPINCPNSDQFRCAGSGGILNISNSPASLGTSIFVVSRGTVIFSGTTALFAGSGLLERPNATGVNSSITLKDNASLTFGTSASLGGGKASGTLGLTLQDNAALTCGTTFDADASTTTGAASTINLNGGTLTVGNLTMSLAGGPATINLNGGILKANNNNTSFFPAISGLTAKVTTGGAKINDNGLAITIGEPLTHDSGLGSTADGGLIKLGSGTVTLTGANTYTGNTTISAGTLAFSGSGSIANSAVIAVSGGSTILDVSGVTGGYTLAAAQTLSGIGAVAGAVTTAPGAMLNAGNGSVGTLTFNTNLTLNALSTNNFVVTTAGGASNQIVVAGVLTPNSSVISITSGTALHHSTNTLFTYNTTVNNPVVGSFNATPVFDVTPPAGGTIVDDGAGHITLAVPNIPPVAGPAFSFGTTIGLPMTVQIVGGKYSPTDADGDALTIIFVTGAANGTVSTDGTNITYTASRGTSDSFTYTVGDGFGGTASQTVSVTINATGQSFNQLSAPVNNGDGTMTIKYLGIPGYNYALETTASLAPPVTWSPVNTNAAAANGQLNFTFPTGAGQGFFRTRSVP